MIEKQIKPEKQPGRPINMDRQTQSELSKVKSCEKQKSFEKKIIVAKMKVSLSENKVLHFKKSIKLLNYLISK